MKTGTTRTTLIRRFSFVLLSFALFAALIGFSGAGQASAASGSGTMIQRKLARLHAQPRPLISSGYISSTSWPVVFVHGFSDSNATDCNSYWSNAESYLHGYHAFSGSTLHWTGQLITVGYYNGDTNCNADLRSYASDCTGYYPGNEGTNNEDIRHIACEFSWYLWYHFTQYGQNVQIVAHSMGGLITRWALYATPFDWNFPPYLGAQDVVTLDTQHNGIPSGVQYFYCGDCVQFQQMDTNSAFIWELYLYGQNPQGAGWGTDWTLEGTFGSSWGFPCSIVNYEYHSATYMNLGHKVGYYSPCYSHSGILSDTSDNSDATVDRCNGCVTDPSNWTRLTNAPHSLRYMLYGLYSSSW